MNKLIVGNLKSSLNAFNVDDYLNQINKNKYSNLVLCPSYKYLQLFNSTNYILGAQDLSSSIPVFELKRHGVQYVILGHYDRKRLYNENDDDLKKKISLCISEDLKIIICIGNMDNESKDELMQKVLNILNCIPKDKLINIIIAYEPYNLIGKDIPVDVSIINETVKCVKSVVKEEFKTDIKVIYGGNVNEENIYEVMNICDGILAGRLCFDVHKFTQILHNFYSNL